MSSNKLIVILGPTASGKSALAIKLALRLSSGQAKKRFKVNGVEIVSADSRQVYKGMDIGTAKPNYQKSSKNRRNKIAMALVRRRFQGKLIQRIPHYLIDLVHPNEEFNVALYKKLAIRIIKDIQRRGKLPLLVGGTGLYIQAVVDNLNFPKVPPQRKSRKELGKKSVKELFKIYKKLDPKGAKFIEKYNKRRLIRAIEVCKVTGKPFSEQRKKGKPLFDVLEIGIKFSKAELKKRISERIDKMIELGLEKEVRNLVKKYGWVSSIQTIGYQEWFPYFEGEITKEEVKENIKTHTFQFAKRQMNWFKRDKRIKWIPSTHQPFRYAEKLIKEFLK